MHGQITSALRTEPVAGFCDYDNELWDLHKTGTSLPMRWSLTSEGGLYYVHILAVSGHFIELSLSMSVLQWQPVPLSEKLKTVLKVACS
jgi:hypothetical protein